MLELLKHPTVLAASAGYHDTPPLFKASWAGYRLAVRRMLELGMEPNMGVSTSRTTPLMAAAGNAHFYVVEELIKAGARVGQVDAHGFTALHDAAGEGCAVVCSQLMSAGAPINACTLAVKWGGTPLHQACQKGQAAAARVLLGHAGIDTEMEDEAGFTPLEVARRAGHGEIVELLEQHAAQYTG